MILNLINPVYLRLIIVVVRRIFINKIFISITETDIFYIINSIYS